MKIFQASVVLVMALPFAATAAAAPNFAKSGQAFLKRYCVECHSGEEPEAALLLTGYTANASLIPRRKTWDAVLRMVESTVMPPADAVQPTARERSQFLDLIRGVFEEYDRTAAPDPGRITMRRLNRREYANTVRDLLGVDFDPTGNFPADDVGHGFDNVGDVLTLSPLLMERYLDAAETIAARVIVPDPPPPSKRYLAGRYLQPGGSTTQARFRRMDVTAEDPKVSGPFTGPGGYMKFSADADLYYRATLYAETESQSPVRVALFIQGSGLTDVSTEAELATLMGSHRSVLKNAKLLKVYEITARKPDDRQTIEFLISRNGDINNAGIALVQPPDGEQPAVLHIEHLWSEGPLETRPESHRMLLATSPGKTKREQQQQVLTRLLRRAYRRPPAESELQRLSDYVETSMAAGDSWEAAVQKVIQIILCSPKFLFRVEPDHRPADSGTRPVDPFHLASRLSYFLWSSMPDDELLELAETGRLPLQLDGQVRRMLADERSTELVRSFSSQWLQIERLAQVAPDRRLYPSFSEPLRAAMFKETELFFAAVLREDRPLTDLINADFTFLNATLAKHYGITDTNGNLTGQPADRPPGQPIKSQEFVRVGLSGNVRGGLLTQASILTVTSNPTRTSPVKRGKWVLEQLLGTPPPPPPSNVPELESPGRELTGTLREQMEQHRKNPACAACHAGMDPLGFAFEHFDAIGAWRMQDREQDIDASGELPDGTTFSGTKDLQAVLLARKDDFTKCLTEKMLIYALGRGLEYYDGPTVSRIARQVAADDYRFSAVIAEIVKSEPFLNRRGPDQQQ